MIKAASMCYCMKKSHGVQTQNYVDTAFYLEDISKSRSFLMTLEKGLNIFKTNIVLGK